MKQAKRLPASIFFCLCLDGPTQPHLDLAMDFVISFPDLDYLLQSVSLHSTRLSEQCHHILSKQ